jgi:alpha-beta hydrolase superfamily lysophospholipase
VTSHLQYLTTAEGRIAYELFEPPSGGGRGLVVTIPGMGDLRSTYRFLVPALVDAGIRVAATDLRGHGDSDATFQRYGDAETAQDVVALVEALRAEEGVVLPRHRLTHPRPAPLPR